jgi:hypothetical protein
MKAHECHHCKQWIEEDEEHDCWTTTEAALTADLSEDLKEAYERLRESALELGGQRIYASHSSVMFSRAACHFFVRPKRSYLELCLFLGRVIKAPQVRKVVAVSKLKRAHLLRIRHRDEVEAPITDWMREAYELQDHLSATVKSRVPGNKSARARVRSPAKSAARTKARPGSPREARGRSRRRQ